MAIRVYQLSDRATREQRAEAMMGFSEEQHVAHCGELWDQQLYDLVAVVRSESLDVAYRGTNSVEVAWWADGGYVPDVVEPRFHGDGCRSTSVGDCMLVEETGEVHVVASFGFELLPVARVFLSEEERAG
jgi:hypothetical protein